MQISVNPANEFSEDVLEAYRRLTEMQGLVTDVLGDFVHRPLDEVAVGIDEAIARLGAFVGADRTYVFEMRPGDLLSNTHEWCASGIQPEMDTLEDLPQNVVHFWLKPLAEGRPVYVPDWTCHGLMPLRLLIYAALRSKAKGLFQPRAECLRRGL